MSAKDTVRFCGTLFEILMDKKISFEIFEKTLLRKQKELENRQEIFNLKEVVLDGKK